MTEKLAYTINEACEAVGLKRVTIYKLLAEGKLEAIKVGNRTLIPSESLHALINKAEPFKPNR